MNCAGAVARDGDGRVLLVLRRNEPSSGVWSIPGGRIEPGETPREAAARELYEETGLVADIGEELVTVDFGPYVVSDFAATVTGGALRPGDDALDARWWTVEEMRSLPLSPGLLEALGL